MWILNILKLFVAVAVLIGSTMVAAAYNTSIKNNSQLGSVVLAANAPCPSGKAV